MISIVEHKVRKGAALHDGKTSRMQWSGSRRLSRRLSRGLTSVMERITFRRRLHRLLGISRIILGSASVVLQIIALLIIIRTSTTIDFIGAVTYFCSGVWCGAFYSLSGIVGLVCSKRKSKPMIVAAMTVSVISLLIFGLLHIFFTGIGIMQADRPYHRRDVDQFGNLNYTKIQRPWLLAVYCFMLVVAMTQWVLDFWCVLLCSKHLCLRKQHPALSLSLGNTNIRKSKRYNAEVGVRYSQQQQTCDIENEAESDVTHSDLNQYLHNQTHHWRNIETSV